MARVSEGGPKVSSNDRDVKLSIVDSAKRKSLGGQMTAERRSQASVKLSGKRSQKNKKTVYNMAGMAGGGDKLDDFDWNAVATKKKEREERDAQDQGLSGEERLLRMTKKPAVDGLDVFTQLTGTGKNQKKHGIQLEVMASVIQDDEYQLTACLALPWTLIFFCLFMLLFQQHYTTSFVFLNENTLRRGMSLDDAIGVSNIDGIYDWLENKFLPFFYTTDQTLDNGWTPTLQGGDFQQQMGAFLVRSHYSTSQICEDEIIKDYNYECNNMWSVDASGNQQLQKDASLFSGTLNGWTKTRRLQANDRNYPERSADPSNWLVDLLGRVSRWFPSKAKYVRAGRWKDAPVAKDGVAADAQASHVKAAPSNDPLTQKEGERPIQSKDYQFRFAESRKKEKRRGSWKKLKAWRPFKASRRIVDPMDSYRHEDKNDETRALLSERKDRILVASRPELGMTGWIPYPFVKKDVWETIVPMSAPQDMVKSTIQQWKSSKLIDRSSLFFGVEAIFRNPSIGEGVLSHAFINFIFSRGGHIYVDIIFQSMVLADDKLTLLYGFLWIALLIFNTIATPGRTCSAWKRRRLRSHMMRFWNLLEWFLIFYGWVIVMIFMAERWGIRKFNKQFKDYQSERRTIAADGLQQFDVDWFDKIHENIYNTGSIDIYLQTFVANYHLWLILRFFMASRGQPRLAIVVNTMRNAAIDLVHLFLVFAIIFIAYVVAGHILFGRRMAPFATLEGSIAYTIQIVLMKEFDFQTLTQQDFVTSCIWVYTFVLLVVLVLINIILAMIFDTYGEVRTQVSEQDSLAFTFRRIFDQLRLMNEWVGNTDLLLALRKLSEKDQQQVTPESFQDAVGGIGNHQLVFLFQQAKNKIESMMTKGNKNALPEAIASVLMGVSQLKEGVALMDPRFKQQGGGDKMNSESKGGDDPPPTYTSGLDDESNIRDADGQPKWLKNGFIPFLAQQQNLFSRAYDDLYSVESQLVGRGIDAKRPKTGFPVPADPKSKLATEEPLIMPWTVEEAEEMRRSMAGEGLARGKCVASSPPPSGVPSSIGKQERKVAS